MLWTVIVLVLLAVALGYLAGRLAAPARPAASTPLGAGTTGSRSVAGTPTATPAPTLAPASGYVTPRATRQAATPTGDFREIVAAAVRQVRSGKIEAAVDYGQGDRSAATVLFDLGDAAHPPRLHLTSSYQGAKGSQSLELIAIGERAWQRQSGGRWTPVSHFEGVWGQVQPFLPRLDEVASLQVYRGQTVGVIEWYDATRNTDVRLHVDPETGVPQHLRSVSRDDGSIMTIDYSEWGAPVEIAPPPGV